MKAHRAYPLFPGLPRTPKNVSRNKQGNVERLRLLFALIIKRLIGTGERLRATLGDPD